MRPSHLSQQRAVLGDNPTVEIDYNEIGDLVILAGRTFAPSMKGGVEEQDCFNGRFM